MKSGHNYICRLSKHDLTYLNVRCSRHKWKTAKLKAKIGLNSWRTQGFIRIDYNNTNKMSCKGERSRAFVVVRVMIISGSKTHLLW